MAAAGQSTLFGTELMFSLIQSSISVFGLFSVDPALFAFGLTFIIFAGLNYLDYKRFD